MKALLSLLGSIGLVASTGITTVVSCDKSPTLTIDDLPETNPDYKNFTGGKSEFIHANEIIDLGKINVTQFIVTDNYVTQFYLGCALRSSIENIISSGNDSVFKKHPNGEASKTEYYDLENYGLLDESKNSKDGEIDSKNCSKAKYIYKEKDSENYYSIILKFTINIVKSTSENNF